MRFKGKVIIILQGRADKKFQEEGEKSHTAQSQSFGKCWLLLEHKPSRISSSSNHTSTIESCALPHPSSK